MAVICFGAIPRGSSHHGIAHADEPPPPAFVSFSLAYEGNAVILQTCTEKLPVFVNQPTACSYFSARHRSASLRTVRLLLSLLPPLILFHPLRVMSTHAYSLKLTPTCTHSHVHSVFIFSRSVVELVIAAVSCLLLLQACIPSRSACLHQPYCLYRFFFFFFVFVKMIHVNILQCRRFQNNHSNLPHSSNRIHSADTKAGFWVMRHKWRSVVQQAPLRTTRAAEVGICGKANKRSRNGRLLSFSGDRQLPHAVSCSRYQTNQFQIRQNEN